MYVDEVLPLTCNEYRDMKMATLNDISTDEMARVICAVLNTSQTEVNGHQHGIGTTHFMLFIIINQHSMTIHSAVLLQQFHLSFSLSVSLFVTSGYFG